MDPYKVLGVPSNADWETIDKAHKELVKKYHPDRYVNNPLSDLAEEKLKEINEAYEILKKGHKTNANTYSGNYSNTSGGTGEFSNIRNMINMGRVAEAETTLDSMSNKTAEWFFLKGLCAIKRGWQDRAYTYIQTAVSMDPNNQEYRFYYNQFMTRANTYRTYGNNNGYSNDNSLDCCLNLWCLDSLCECMGGDLINCC